MLVQKYLSVCNGGEEETMLSEQARALLEGRHFAVLATINEDGTPQLTTMWYELAGDTIIMNTRVGRVKERNMRRNSSISLCVQQGYQYVTLSGHVEIIDNPEMAQQDICRLATRYDGEEAAQMQMRERFSKEQRITLRLKWEHVMEYFGTDTPLMLQQTTEAS